MSKQLKKIDKSDGMYVDNCKETVCVVRTPEGRAAEKRNGTKEDRPAYIIFSILSLVCTVGAVLSLELVSTLKLLCLIPAGFAVVFAILAKSKRSGVLSIMALVFSIIAAFAVCTISVACVCVQGFAHEAKEEHIDPIIDKVSEWIPWN